ncbi:tetratricopeptide repeat protein [Litorimonas taeanensis]|uniref:Tetratricopeptide repeat protein n=1 Tax=Litorimonas taeanensis TaxID=568099 RepID=A0A420WM54_9PROT|nr:tetratricopeptide repeat protein [Litorimonas taeanensis]RKQ71992.1 tetratricopeptide repeat protein [Litorimonas taeanensis]
MKNILVSTFFVAALSATSAFANEDYTGGVVSPEAAQNIQLCLESNVDVALNKSIRACTQAYKASVPNYNVRSDILTRRGWLQLSAGKYEQAARDFKWASKLNDVNEFAYLGDGFAALMQKDYDSAIAYFNDCKTHNDAAPLAYYGLGMTKELAGDSSGALEAYQKAANLRPEWQAPLEELSRIKA